MDQQLEVNCPEDLRNTGNDEHRGKAEMKAQRIMVRELYKQHNRIFDDDGLGFHYCNGRDLYRGAPDLGKDWIVEWIFRLSSDTKSHTTYDQFCYSPLNEKFCGMAALKRHFSYVLYKDINEIVEKNRGHFSFDANSRSEKLSNISFAPRIDSVLVAVGELVILGDVNHLRCLDKAEAPDYSLFKSAAMKLIEEEVKSLPADKASVNSEFILLLARLFNHPYVQGEMVECDHVRSCLDLYKDVKEKSFSDRDVDNLSSDDAHKYYYELGETCLASVLRLMKMKSSPQ